MSDAASRPIGVFDSGVGGLTVVRALMEYLPFENILYFGDTARVPYGVKSVATIERFSEQIVSFMLEHKVKGLVIACNTIAAVAADSVRLLAGNMPVLDVIEAGAKAAVKATCTGEVGVIATSTTVNSNAYAQAIHAINPHTRVYSQSCPLFVPLVEEGWLDHPVTRLTAQEYLKSIMVEHVDTLVLGCTHYPLLKPLLNTLTDGKMHLVDSAITTAEATTLALGQAGLLNSSRQVPRYEFYVSDIPLRFQTIGERFLGRSMPNLNMVELVG